MTDKGNGSVPEYEEKGFLDKVKGYGRAIGRPALEKAFLAYHVLRDPDTPAKAKAILGGSLAYLVMPVDAISDFLPVVGYTDDLAVLGAALAVVVANIKHQHHVEAKASVANLLGEAPGRIAE